MNFFFFYCFKRYCDCRNRNHRSFSLYCFDVSIYFYFWNLKTLPNRLEIHYLKMVQQNMTWKVTIDFLEKKVSLNKSISFGQEKKKGKLNHTFEITSNFFAVINGLCTGTMPRHFFFNVCRSMCLKLVFFFNIMIHAK